jgi:predicted nucleic acid-binding protein
LIFLDTNVISETLRKTPDPAVLAWLVGHDSELALPTVTIAEIAYGIRKIRPDECVNWMKNGLADWTQRFSGRFYGITESRARLRSDNG